MTVPLFVILDEAFQGSVMDALLDFYCAEKSPIKEIHERLEEAEVAKNDLIKLGKKVKIIEIAITI